MNNHIILTAAQAAGRLTGYREKCEVELPANVYVEFVLPSPWRVFYKSAKQGYVFCTPPRDTDITYAVKEPCWIPRDGSLVARFGLCLNSIDDHALITSDQMPDWAVRQHARITDRKLIISDGELWWDFGDLEKVAKNGN